MFRHALLVLSLVVALLLSACGLTSVGEIPATLPPPTAEPATPPTPRPTAVPAPTPLPPDKIAEKLAPSTVMIRADFPETAIAYEGKGSGTGIVFTDDGYIVTNAHVVQGASAVTVAAAASASERSARIVGISTCDDLAVIKVDNTAGLTPAAFGKSADLRAGEEVVALGYPLGDTIDTNISVTRGIISKLNTTISPYESLIQTDAAINPGNSGGPLINEWGQVIGINALGVDSDVATNISFAISIDLVKSLIGELKQGDHRQWLGMNLVSNSYADYFGVEDGMVVAAIDSGSPASRIGVHPADLLLKLEGSTVNSQADVCKILRSHGDGDQLKVDLLRVTDTEQQILQGEIAIGDARANAALGDLKVEKTIPRGASSGDQQSGAGESGSSDAGRSSNLNYTDYDFSADTGDWYTGSTDGHLAEISGGTYNITLLAPDSYLLSPALAAGAGTDMGMVADVLVRGDARAGVALRYGAEGDTTSYYTCWIDGANHYGCFVSVKDHWTTLAEPATTGAVLPSQVNRVALTAVGDEIVFSVNGTQIATFHDSGLARGIPALYLENFSTNAGASFDNITIVTPK